MTKIRTIKRTKDMPKDAKWVATDADGRVWTYIERPMSNDFYQEWRTTGQHVAFLLSGGYEPQDFRTTLRRIVDRDPPKKPKRKMVRIWYFIDDIDRIRAFCARKECDYEYDMCCGDNHSPIASALIPAPRRKGKVT